MRYYDIDKKRSNHAAEYTPKASTDIHTHAGVPNSAMLSVMGSADRGSDRAMSDLGERLRARMSSMLPRAQAQIPDAESEADKLSASVTGGSPEAVKADMGRRMGADFSNVRFHTGAAAAAKADAMGARAFTSGADVYFGTGGFDPSVAAHELVHTAQQGAVSSDTATMSTPAGGVQMKPNIFKRMWNATGGRAIRKHHDAMNELHEAVQSGEWDQLTPEEQKAWKKKNRLAYSRYMKSDKVKAETAFRVAKRKLEQEAAADFLENNQSQLGPSSMLTSDAAGNQTIGHGTADAAEFDDSGMSAADVLEKGAGIADNMAISPGVASSFQEAKWIGNSGANYLGGTLGAVNTLTGGVGAGNAIKNIHKARQNGDVAGGIDAGVDLAGNAGKMFGGAAGVAKAAGKEVAGKYAAGADIVTGSVDVYKGARQIHAGRMKSNAMSDFQEQHFAGKTRADLAEDDLLMRDIATQGKMEGTRQKIKGAGKVVTGAVDAAAGAAEFTGVGAALGAGLKAGNAVAKAGFAAANQVQKNRMVEKVVEQTTGLTDEKIREFQKLKGIKSFSRAKQALMKAKGYESGQRAELYADQTEKRGQYLANLVNAAPGSGNANTEKANELVSGLGVKKKTDGTYDAEEISKAMGHWKSRSEIASGHNTIKKMLRRRRIAGATP